TSVVTEYVRDSLVREPEEDAHRLGTIEAAYRRLGGRYAEVADTLTARRAPLLAEVRKGMADFAFLLENWQALTRACSDAGLSVTR
ncbi:hypothetical protein G3M55_12205, partial [Streptomyces sp. SID8455]|nr:hypothetical protein [Streptomyces sp. SID8455]